MATETKDDASAGAVPVTWSKVAKFYSVGASAISLEAARLMTEAIDPIAPWSEATHILDLGCGTGLVTQALFARYGSILPVTASIKGIDTADAMLDQFRALKSASSTEAPKLWDRVTIELGDAMDLPASSVLPGSLSHIVAGFVMFILPDSQSSLKQCHAALRAGGVMASTSWVRNDFVDAALSLKSFYPDLEMSSSRGQWSTEEGVRAEYESAGFRNVQVQAVDVHTDIPDIEELCDTFVMNMPGVVKAMAGFDEQQQKTAREVVLAYLRKLCPTDPGRMGGQLILGLGVK